MSFRNIFPEQCFQRRDYKSVLNEFRSAQNVSDTESIGSDKSSSRGRSYPFMVLTRGKTRGADELLDLLVCGCCFRKCKTEEIDMLHLRMEFLKLYSRISWLRFSYAFSQTKQTLQTFLKLTPSPSSTQLGWVQDTAGLRGWCSQDLMAGPLL